MRSSTHQAVEAGLRPPCPQEPPRAAATLCARDAVTQPHTAWSKNRKLFSLSWRLGVCPQGTSRPHTLYICRGGSCPSTPGGSSHCQLVLPHANLRLLTEGPLPCACLTWCSPLCLSLLLSSGCQSSVTRAHPTYHLNSCICKVPISKLGHMLRYWGVRALTHVLGGHNSIHNTFLAEMKELSSGENGLDLKKRQKVLISKVYRKTWVCPYLTANPMIQQIIPQMPSFQ